MELIQYPPPEILNEKTANLRRMAESKNASEAEKIDESNLPVNEKREKYIQLLGFTIPEKVGGGSRYRKRKSKKKKSKKRKSKKKKSKTRRRRR